jgi:hypothetical protein
LRAAKQQCLKHCGLQTSEVVRYATALHMDNDPTLYYIIDRFEGNDWAVLEGPNGRTFDVPRFWLPDAAREGDVLRLETSGEFDELEADPSSSELYFSIDEAEAQRRLERVEDIRSRLKRGPAGDIDL